MHSEVVVVVDERKRSVVEGEWRLLFGVGVGVGVGAGVVGGQDEGTLLLVWTPQSKSRLGAVLRNRRGLFVTQGVPTLVQVCVLNSNCVEASII